jgi:hypothetical protein
MEFLLSHWHCIVPVLVIVVVLLLRNRGKNRTADTEEHHPGFSKTSVLEKPH